MKFIRHKALYDPNLRKLQDECSWRSERLPRDALRLDSVCRFNGLYHLCHLRSTIFEPYSPYSRTETCGTDPPVGSPPDFQWGDSDTDRYEMYYDIWLGGQYTFKIIQLHKQYGPIIRISPWEIHIADPVCPPESKICFFRLDWNLNRTTTIPSTQAILPRGVPTSTPISRSSLG